MLMMRPCNDDDQNADDHDANWSNQDGLGMSQHSSVENVLMTTMLMMQPCNDDDQNVDCDQDDSEDIDLIRTDLECLSTQA